MNKQEKMIAYQKERSKDLVEKVKECVDNMISNGEKITPYSVWKKAGVSKGFVYKNVECIKYIEKHRTESRPEKRDVESELATIKTNIDKMLKNGTSISVAGVAKESGLNVRHVYNTKKLRAYIESYRTKNIRSSSDANKGRKKDVPAKIRLIVECSRCGKKLIDEDYSVGIISKINGKITAEGWMNTPQDGNVCNKCYKKIVKERNTTKKGAK